ncbi:TIGR02530 family flagellar biosynthesis protein [Domibacillus aminovorans]|uniref:Flagellar protein n=1 Tax=Domibacillus aminovorans TaxID=29332 RepID=A0A177LA78_9BACI|nr:TIGR02530 family flagellar biosynthesis protein [Domibacillus aminovorans]OAH62085.1 flagellar protein [Domibacillus aminovorans]
MKPVNPIITGIMQPFAPVKKNVDQKVSSSFSFGETLEKVMSTSSKPIISKPIISKHAEQRLKERGIAINSDQWQSIGEKLAEAGSKGVKDSLILLKDAALIASAKNNTVITVMNREEARSQIFTNINGTIVMDNV